MRAEYLFLKQTKPFCNLPNEILRQTVEKLSVRKYRQGEILSHQGKSNFQHIIIIETGSLELYYDIDGKKILSSFLSSGDVCGGIALLKNRGSAIRTIVASSDVSCYHLPGEIFLDICLFYQVNPTSLLLRSLLMPKSLKQRKKNSKQQSKITRRFCIIWGSY